MRNKLHEDAMTIVRAAIEAVKPDEAVRRAMEGFSCEGRLFLVAAGKAAWQMAEAALSCIPKPLSGGVVVTKYGHVKHPLEGIECYEAGHPVPDENGFTGTAAALALTADLRKEDTVLFLLSGGGSALFEKPLIPPQQLQRLTSELLAGGADIVEINTVRKRLSAVKGGRFAAHCAPAKVYAVVLSDVLGDPLDMIASGPVTEDSSTCAQARAVAEKYKLTMTEEIEQCLSQETEKALDNVCPRIIGSVRELCRAAETACRELGYEPVFLTDRLCCEAREAGSVLASILKSHEGCGRKLAFLAGGETVVHLTGTGLGGRNQELALSAAAGIEGMEACLFSVGSDGTDGPTDAAGGYSDGDTAGELRAQGLEIAEVLSRNDSYHALQKTKGLIMTGPTGTNVNDVAVGLLG